MQVRFAACGANEASRGDAVGNGRQVVLGGVGLATPLEHDRAAHPVGERARGMHAGAGRPCHVMPQRRPTEPELVVRVAEAVPLLGGEQLRGQASARAEIVSRLVAEGTEAPPGREPGSLRRRAARTRQPLIARESDRAQAQGAATRKGEREAEHTVPLHDVVVLAGPVDVVGGVERRPIVVEVGKVARRRETVHAEIEANTTDAPSRGEIPERSAERSHARAGRRARGARRAGGDRDDPPHRRLPEGDRRGPPVHLDALDVAEGQGRDVHRAAGGEVERHAVEVHANLVGVRAAQGEGGEGAERSGSGDRHPGHLQQQRAEIVVGARAVVGQDHRRRRGLVLPRRRGRVRPGSHDRLQRGRRGRRARRERRRRERRRRERRRRGRRRRGRRGRRRRGRRERRRRGRRERRRRERRWLVGPGDRGRPSDRHRHDQHRHDRRHPPHPRAPSIAAIGTT